MKQGHWVCLVAIALAAALVVWPAVAQDDTGARGKGGDPRARAGNLERAPAGEGAGMRGRGPMMRGPGPGELPPDLAAIPNLTEEQKKQIGEIRKTAMEKIRQIQEQMREDIKKLLTPEQVKAMEESARRGPPGAGPGLGFGGVTLTDEQKKTLEDARTQMQKTEDPTVKRQVMREAFEKVRASLTDEQKKQAEEARKSRGPGGGEPGGARPLQP